MLFSVQKDGLVEQDLLVLSEELEKMKAVVNDIEYRLEEEKMQVWKSE